MLARTTCAALRKVSHRFHRPTVRMKRGLVIHSSAHTNSVWVPHVRTSVRGLIKTGRSPIKALTSFPQSRTWVPRISLVFGEMWDSTALSPKIFPAKCSSPFSRMECFFSESRMQIINATGPNGKSGGPQWRDLLFFPSSNQSNLSHTSPVSSRRKWRDLPAFAMPGRSTRWFNKINPNGTLQNVTLRSRPAVFFP
jgi:hypothetical protein